MPKLTKKKRSVDSYLREHVRDACLGDTTEL
jgi:hypothetical protein